MSDEGQRITIKTEAAGRTDAYRYTLDKLHIKPGWNSRDTDFDETDEDDLALAHSIIQNGVREPLTVVWESDKAYVTNGHRRLAACRYAVEKLGAEIKSVPVQLEARLSSDADQILSQITRNSSKPLKPLEMGRVYKRLLDLGWSEDQIATRVGRTRQHVTYILNLQAAPSAVTNMVRSGEVSATLASQTMQSHKGDGQAAAAALQKAVTKAKSQGKAKATRQHVEAPVSAAGRSLQAIFARSKTERKHLDNTVTVEFSVEDFDIITAAFK